MPAIATATLKSLSPYSSSRCHEEPKKPKESADAYEQRTWRSKCHSTDDGRVLIPQMTFKFAIMEAAKALSERIPGKGTATYTKHFVSGIMVPESLVLPIKVKDVEEGRFHCHANGKRGSGSRVWRYFPMINSWQGVVVFQVLDSTITKDVFVRHLDHAGKFIGIGRFRPANGGINGRFMVADVDWEEIEV